MPVPTTPSDSWRFAWGVEVRGSVWGAPATWLIEGIEGIGVSAVMPEELSDFSGGAPFNDARVEVSLRRR